MNIGIVGSGNIGANAARLFVRAGHEVVVANSRSPRSLSDLAREIGASAATAEEAARLGDVVLLAVPFYAVEAMPADALAGRIVVDATNYYAARDGRIDFGGLASSESSSPDASPARVVKAFNTIYYARLANGGGRTRRWKRLAIFVAGDDDGAKSTVSALVEGIGFAPVDAGTLHQSKAQEPGAPVYNVPLTGEQAREAIS